MVFLEMGKAIGQLTRTGIPMLTNKLAEGFPGQSGGILGGGEIPQEMKGNLGIQTTEKGGRGRIVSQQKIAQAVGLADDIVREIPNVPYLDLDPLQDYTSGRPGLEEIPFGAHQIGDDSSIPGIGFGSAAGPGLPFRFDPVGRGNPDMNEPIGPEKVAQQRDTAFDGDGTILR